MSLPSLSSPACVQSFDPLIEQSNELVVKLKTTSMALKTQLAALQSLSLSEDSSALFEVQNQFFSLSYNSKLEDKINFVENLSRFTYVLEKASHFSKICPHHENEFVETIEPGRHLNERLRTRLRQLEQKYKEDPEISDFQFITHNSTNMIFRSFYDIYVDYTHTLNSSKCREPYKRIKVIKVTSTSQYLKDFNNFIDRHKLDASKEWTTLINSIGL